MLVADSRCRLLNELQPSINNQRLGREGKGPATLAQIIGAANAVNQALLANHELHGGLTRLTKSGCEFGRRSKSIAARSSRADGIHRDEDSRTRSRAARHAGRSGSHRPRLLLRRAWPGGGVQ